jgi:hypothetical protein
MKDWGEVLQPIAFRRLRIQIALRNAKPTQPHSKVSTVQFCLQFAHVALNLKRPLLVPISAKEFCLLAQLLNLFDGHTVVLLHCGLFLCLQDEEGNTAEREREGERERERERASW